MLIAQKPKFHCPPVATAINTPGPIITVPTPFIYAEFWPFKNSNRTANTGNVWVGYKENIAYKIVPGQVVPFYSEPGSLAPDDLSYFWFYAETVGDGVFVQLRQPSITVVLPSQLR